MDLCKFFFTAWLLYFSTGCLTGRRAFFTDTALHEPPLLGLEQNPSILPGTYLGYLKLNSKLYKIPAKLDLIMTAKSDSEVNLKGVLKFTLGDFYGDEYRSIYLESVTFKRRDRQLTFQHNSMPIVFSKAKLRSKELITLTVVDKNHMLSGEVAVIYAGLRANQDAQKHLDKLFASIPTFPAIHGEYVSQCKNVTNLLQLETSKWSDSNFQQTSFLEGYRISGRWGFTNPVICGEAKTCLRSSFSQGQLTLQNQHLVLTGNPRNFACTVGKDHLLCNDCKFLKRNIAATPKNIALSSRDAYHVLKADTPIRLHNPKIIRGEYFGYLHHELRNEYQFIRLKVDTQSYANKKTSKKIDYVSAVATLFFGEKNSNEFIAYRFDNAPLTYHHVFNGNGNLFIQASYWTKSSLRGIVYSKTFGRIGTVELRKTEIPELPDGVSHTPLLTGFYRGGDKNFELWASPEVSEQFYEFFPLNLRGYVHFVNIANQGTAITKGRLDYFTGKLALVLDDGRIVIGHAAKNAKYLIEWPPSPRFGSLMDQLTYLSFEKIKNAAPAKVVRKN